MLAQLSALPEWIYRLVWSLIIILTSSLLGQFVRRTVCRRLTVWAEKTSWKWDDLIVDALRRGIPIWSALLGLYIAVGLWPIHAHLLETLNRAIYVCTWLSVTLVCAGLAGKAIALYGSEFRQAMPVTSLTENVARIVIVVLGLLMILNGLGISIAPLLTALGVGGLAVALALQDTLSNFFAGLYLTMSRQIRVGDYIKLEFGQEGYVQDISWRATKIRMLPDNVVLVPNKKLGEAIITNYYLPNRELAVTVDVGVEYGSELSLVERMTVDVAREVMQTVPGGVPTFTPIVRYNAFGDYSIRFTVVLRVKEFVDQYLIKHEFIKRLYARYAAEGITIPFPTQTVYARSST